MRHRWKNHEATIKAGKQEQEVKYKGKRDYQSKTGNGKL